MYTYIYDEIMYIYNSGVVYYIYICIHIYIRRRCCPTPVITVFGKWLTLRLSIVVSGNRDCLNTHVIRVTHQPRVNQLPGPGIH